MRLGKAASCYHFENHELTLGSERVLLHLCIDNRKVCQAEFSCHSMYCFQCPQNGVLQHLRACPETFDQEHFLCRRFACKNKVNASTYFKEGLQNLTSSQSLVLLIATPNLTRHAASFSYFNLRESQPLTFIF